MIRLMNEGLVATPRTQAPPLTLRVAYTPDSDDAFNYFAWEFDRVRLQQVGVRAEFEREHIIALNRAAQREEYDVVAVSSVAYPSLADRYWILAVGNSVGRGYGPELASKRYRTIDELAGKTIAVAGLVTTGGVLARIFCPGARFVEMRYDHMADAVAAGQVDAGVMIHEELIFFPEKGLHAVADLGKCWCEQTCLPLPVGLNLVRKAVGRELAHDIAATCRASLQWALHHFDEAFRFASQFGRGCASLHVEMFSNGDTLRMAPDVHQAARVMFDRVADLGLGPRLKQFEVIDA